MINNVTLMGRLTATPELKKTPSGVSVVSFSIAVERNYKQGDQRITDFINCVAWQGTAEFISQYFGKGDMIAVIGEIQIRNYTDRSGNKREAFEIKVNQASFCGKKSSDDTANKPETNINANEPAEAPTYTELAEDEDLPF